MSAQNISFETDYTPVKSSGILPKEVVYASTKKYRKELNRIKKDDSRSERKTKKRFLLRSNFLIDDMLRSGYVLYNDPLGVYVNEVADIVLKKDPSLRKKLQFYVLRSTDVNAFATDRGIIFVTMGMLSQLENEAQLAFVLCHEIVHYKKKHALDFALEENNINKGASQKYVLKKSKTDKELFKFSYSRDLETEADAAGIKRYLSTNYDLESLDGVFDVLAYSFLPFEDKKFNKSFFETEHLVFPKEFQMEETRAIQAINEDEDDERSSHPNTGKRRKAVQLAIKGTSNSGRVKYVLDEKRFESIREQARFEMPLLSLQDESFYRSLYESYLLLDKYPNNKYLKKTVAKGLYIASKYRNAEYKLNVETDSLEGEMQGLFYFMENLSDEELAFLTASHLWKLNKEYPDDSEITQMSKDAMTELVHHHEIKISELLSERPKEIEIKESPADKVEEQEEEKEDESQVDKKNVSETVKVKKRRSKLDKIRGNKKDAKEFTAFAKAAFASYLEDEDFKAAWKNAEKISKNREKRAKYYESDKGQKELRKKHYNKKKKGQRLGIKKVVIVNPYYLNMDSRKKNAVQYEKSEVSQVDFTKLLKDNAKLAGLKTTILDTEKLSVKSSDVLNEVALIQSWISDQENFSDLSITPGFQQDEIDAFVKKYGTKYFCRTGVISLRERKKVWPFLVPLILPYYLPWSIAHAVERPYEFLYYNMVYNAETGAYDVVKFEFFDTADTETILNLHTYDAFLQIKSK